MRKLMEMRETRQLRTQADAVFAGLRKDSDRVRENPELAVEVFGTLRELAPALAAKPLVARTFVEHVIDNRGHIPPDTAQMLANTQTVISRLNTASGGGFLAGLKEPMNLFSHSVSLPKDKGGGGTPTSSGFGGSSTGA